MSWITELRLVSPFVFWYWNLNYWDYHLQVLQAQSAAKANGYSDVLYLDSIEKRYLEEVSSCNVFVVKVWQLIIKLNDSMHITDFHLSYKLGVLLLFHILYNYFPLFPLYTLSPFVMVGVYMLIESQSLGFSLKCSAKHFTVMECIFSDVELFFYSLLKKQVTSRQLLSSVHF